MIVDTRKFYVTIIDAPGNKDFIKNMITETSYAQGEHHQRLRIEIGRSRMNVRHRKRKTGRIGHPHKLTKDDAMKWFQTKYDGIILNSKK